jgi:hypothetical protein
LGGSLWGDYNNKSLRVIMLKNLKKKEGKSDPKKDTKK